MKHTILKFYIPLFFIALSLGCLFSSCSKENKAQWVEYVCHKHSSTHIQWVEDSDYDWDSVLVKVKIDGGNQPISFLTDSFSVVFDTIFFPGSGIIQGQSEGQHTYDYIKIWPATDSVYCYLSSHYLPGFSVTTFAGHKR